MSQNAAGILSGQPPGVFVKVPRVKKKHEIISSIEAALISKLRERGSIARVDLARELNLSPSTIGIYVSRLIAEGYLTEGEQVTRNFGRPATILTRSPDGGRFIGLDIEARNIFVTSVDFAQQPIRQLHARLSGRERSADAVLNRAESLLDEINKNDSRKLLGIGIGVPGFVDPSHGVALYYEHIADWRDVPLRERLEKRYGVPVEIENNIRSLALAELWFGQARGLRDFICVGLRSGIGAGIVTAGQLCRGYDNSAGEVGTWPCGDANAQSLEYYASVNGLLERYRAESKGVELRDFSAFIDRLKEGDSLARELVGQAGKVCGMFLLQMNLLLNPERIILAGDVLRAGEAFLRSVRTSVSSVSLRPYSKAPRIDASELGQFAGAMGAAALAAQVWRPPR
jgi:predicted NBD/HSP70 family sugar kinase